MQHSLTIIAPIRNGESETANRMRSLLEIAADLTNRMDLIVVDDASDDETYDVLQELAESYPQMKIIRASQRLGFRAAIRRGMTEAKGDFIMVQDYRAPISAADIHQIWELRSEEKFVAARTEARKSESLMGRLSAWGQTLVESRENNDTPAIYMLRADSAELLEDSSNSGKLTQERFGRLELVTASTQRRVPRPKLMTRVKDLALGE